jgi:hypothetical protein
MVDGDWSHADAARACRLILRTVQGCAYKYETDIPGVGADYPPTVAAAAEVLRGIAARRGRVEPGGHAQTGILENAGDEVWSAFVDFAPWAYDATVWNSVGDDIVSLADEGTSVVLRLNRQQYDAIAAALGDANLVPENEWRGPLARPAFLSETRKDGGREPVAGAEHG